MSERAHIFAPEEIEQQRTLGRISWDLPKPDVEERALNGALVRLVFGAQTADLRRSATYPYGVLRSMQDTDVAYQASWDAVTDWLVTIGLRPADDPIPDGDPACDVYPLEPVLQEDWT
ncbi:hypothetical protein [Phycicoccus sp. Soil802]|uniref:hypothetical protein n=1 Tax=Phycicoccus sp. Soil802 TaxID=1736414 RepID=UPI0007023F39|nr:hypothetical protein [Phycicoccus sp. Soil802]KRF22909.1 hypothetical protein ASG91_16175 [Phycicoccus sp. Soil802]